MAKILIIYSTTDGHTLQICRRLQEVIEPQAHQVTLVNIADTESVDLTAFDKIVIGASIRYGKHNPRVTDFITRHQKILESKSNAFFSVNVVARKPKKNQPETNPYLQKFLQRISWRPKKLAVFAGKINYPIYNFVDRFMIRLIMVMTKGPTDPKGVFEFTDWAAVAAFGRVISEM